MIVSDTAIRNRISVFVLAMIIIVVGVHCYMALPRENEPDITIPNVFVSTNYKGVPSTDMETSITIEIENKLKGLDRVKKIHSISSEGLSQINIEFLPGTDIDDVLQKVKGKVDEAKKELPGDLEDDPAVFEVNFSEMPIVIFSLSGTCGITCLKEIADDLEEDFEAIPGVLEAVVTGGLEREIKIEVDPDKLAYYRLPIVALQNAVNSENQNTSGGSITLVVTLSSSLFVALVINPAMAAIFVRVKSAGPAAENADAEAVAAAGERPVAIKGMLLTTYVRILSTALRHRMAVLVGAFAVLILFFQIWLLAVGLEKPVEFFPDLDPKSMYVNIDPPEGADLDYIDRIAKKVEMAVTGVIHEDPDLPLSRYDTAYRLQKHTKADGETFSGPSDLGNVEHIYSKAVETAGVGSAFEANLPNHIGVQFLDMEERHHPSAEDLEEIRRRVRDIPGAQITVAEMQEGPPTGAPINIEISGDDFRVLGRLVKEIRDRISQIPFVEDVQDDYVEGIPSVRIRVDRQKAAIFGLSTNAIGFALKTGNNGLEVSTYREGDKDYDITVTLGESNRRVTDVLRKLMIPTPSGQLVPLTTIAHIDYTGTMGDIIRINHNRVVTVKANVDETKIPGPVARKQAELLLENFPLPAGYRITFTGEFEFQKEAEDFLTKAFMVAVFLIFLILVTLFNSVIQPLIILTAIILSLGGAFLGLTVMRSPFGIIMSGVGVISLAGVVVNNAIVLIDYINKLRERGMELGDALIAAGATRLRPVLLTAVTTVLGLLPMVTGVSFDFHQMAMSYVSESTQWWQNMAIVVIFGLIIATFLTLVVVPTLYSLLESLKALPLRLRARFSDAPGPLSEELM